MPLSDREQQILKEIERDLLADGPGDVDLRETKKSRGRDQIKIGILLFVAGLVCLGLFFASGALVLGIVAFAAMVGGLFFVANGVRDAALSNFRDLSARGPQDVFGRWEERFRNRHKRS